MLILCHQVMFIQSKGHVTMTIELLDTEEAQADDPLDVQVNWKFFSSHFQLNNLKLHID